MTEEEKIVEVMARALYAADPIRLNMEQTPVPWERLEANGFVKSKPLAFEIARAALTALQKAGYAVVRTPIPGITHEQEPYTGEKL